MLTMYIYDVPNCVKQFLLYMVHIKFRKEPTRRSMSTVDIIINTLSRCDERPRQLV